MSSASSTRCALRRAGPPIPLISCPDCGRTVKQARSGTTDHPGCIYYKCKNHGFGCSFWWWELDYVGYLIEHNYPQGDVAFDAVGWAEDRREELELRKKEAKVTHVQGQEEQLLMILGELREMKVLLKIAVGIACVLSAMVAVVVLKK